MKAPEGKRQRAPGAGRKRGSGIAFRIRPSLPVLQLRGVLNYGAFLNTPSHEVGAWWMRLCKEKQAIERASEAFGTDKLEALSWLINGPHPAPHSGPGGRTLAAERRGRLESWLKDEPEVFRRGVELLGARTELYEYLAEQRRGLVDKVEAAFTRLDEAFFQSIADFVKDVRTGKHRTEGRRYSRILDMVEERVCCAEGLALLDAKAVKREAKRFSQTPTGCTSSVQPAALAAVTFLHNPPRCVKPLFTARQVYDYLAEREQGSGTFFRLNAEGESLENNLRQVRDYCRGLGVKLLSK